MNTIFLTKASVDLEPSDIVALTDAMGIRIRSDAGLLWVTVENDLDDYWLRPGESVEIRSPGKVVIEAVKNSRLQLLPSRAAHGLRRVVAARF